MRDYAPIPRWSAMELFFSADCRHDWLTNPADCSCAPAYFCHHARHELERRGVDLVALRKRAARAVERIRALPEIEVLMISIEDGELSGAASAVWYGHYDANPAPPKSGATS
jgi:hypothetical protein